MLDQTKVPAGDRAPGYDPGRDYDVRMDAEDASAAEAMIAALPSNQLGHFTIFRPLIQEYFEALPGMERSEGDLYFTVSLERFRPVAGEEVIELTAADAGLFEGCERQRRWEDMGEEHRVFGIVRDGKVATSTGVAPITPAIATKRRVIAISGLYTETRYRRMGLGKRLVSYVTELILQDGHAPLYWTEPDKVASQSLAQGLGYWQIAQNMTYLWRKV
ncbi:TPA: GNAT family N-acetyltransferase [Candidatus Poribacteria bacterium]|nr:GNAT family N-acetyltransferase [Candidatus Poribacteria bacterium]